MTAAAHTRSPSVVESIGVVERLGVVIHDVGGPGDADPRVLLGLALRRNPRRAQLLVSQVLGKHVPTDPRLVRAAGLLLGARVTDVLDGRALRPLPVDALHSAVAGDRDAASAVHADAVDSSGTAHDVAVLGFAETATALGHCVAEALGADYLHSTRRPVDGVATAGGFTEEHSHATDHLLLPTDPAFLTALRPLVLVDDELSTGRTAFNTIAALHRAAPRDRYVLAALVDSRPPDSRLVDDVAALGARLDVVSLARARIELPADLTGRADAVRAAIDARPGPADPAHPCPDVPRVLLTDLGWPNPTPAGGRHGFGPADHERLAGALPGLAAALAGAAGLRPGARTLVLGTEELMAVPLRLAQELADVGHDVVFSTTTRSPAVVTDDPGYALTSGITFPAHDDPADGPGPRYAYNVGAHGRACWDHVLVVVDPPADTPALDAGLLAALAGRTHALTVVVTP